MGGGGCCQRRDCSKLALTTDFEFNGQRLCFVLAELSKSANSGGKMILGVCKLPVTEWSARVQAQCKGWKEAVSSNALENAPSLILAPAATVNNEGIEDGPAVARNPSNS